MQTIEEIEDQGFYSFRADANALGGFLEAPVQKVIPTLVPVSLPAVGGFTAARSEGFTLDNIVSVEAAYSRVSGQVHPDGSVSILSTSVVEELNLLEVVQAERIVAQLSIWIPADRKGLRVSTAGSAFEGLRLRGRPHKPRYSRELQDEECDPTGREPGASAADIQNIGAEQAKRVAGTFQGRYNATWAQNRSSWTSGQGKSRTGCSLLDGFEDDADQKGCGHIVEICGFGRIILGELLVTPYSAQLVSIRAELGCPVKGRISINCGGGGGISDN